MAVFVAKIIGRPPAGLDEDILPQTYTVTHSCCKICRRASELFGMLRAQCNKEQQAQKVLWQLPNPLYYS